MMIHVSFLVFGLVSFVNCAPNLDWAIDEIIKDFNSQLASRNIKQTAIANLQYNNVFKLLFFPLRLNVIGSGGKIGDWTTLYREGSTSIIQQPNVSLEISGNLGLSDLELSYDSATVRVPFSSYTGWLRASCKKSSFDLEVSAKSENSKDCVATVSKAQLTSIGDCTVALDGTGINHWIKTKYYTYLLNHQLKTDNLVETLNLKLGDLILDKIKGNICKYF